MVTLFIWIIPSMVLHLKWMVYWISIVVIHMFMPKDSNDSTTYLWHCHVSHIGIKRMKKLHVDGSLGSLVFEKFETCEPCLLVYTHEETPCRWIVWTHLILNHLRYANHTTWARWLKSLVFSKMEQNSNLLEVTHFDVCSPINAKACSEYRYVLTSQMIRVDVENIYLMKHKSELLNGSSNFRVK